MKKTKRDFTLQYHITVKCDYNCGHCYLREDTYQNEVRNVHSNEQVKQVIDNFSNFTSNLSEIFGVKIKPVIHYTGGDPLLRKDFFDILEYSVNKGVKVAVLGNPDNINYSVAQRLVSSGVRSFQISLDGPKEMHDQLRRKEGSFEKSLDALTMLSDVGLEKTFAMYNVSKENISHLIDTYKTVNDLGIYGFVFARVVCLGDAKDMDLQISPLEYRGHIKKLDDLIGGVENRRGKNQTRVIMKEPLWSLYNHEKGVLNNLELIEGGCQIGINVLSVLADGTVYACRRMPSEIGKVPEQDFTEIFFNNELLNKFRNFENYQKCKSCDVVNHCRGCPAVSYGQTKDYFSPDPQCWK